MTSSAARTSRRIRGRRTWRTTAAIAAVLGALSLVSSPASAERTPPTTTVETATEPTRLAAPPMAITWAGGPSPAPSTAPAPSIGPTSAPASASASARAGTTPPAAATTPTEEFDLQFDETVTESQAAVFRHAVEIWARELVIRVPVTVAVTFDELPPGALGGATPTSAWVNEPRFPDTDTAYVVALANQHAGSDLDPGVADIDVVISSSVDFYEGTAPEVPPDQYSLLLLALHEIGHGLGHVTWARETSPDNFAVTIGGVPLSYDRFVQAGNGRRIVDMSASELRTALRSPLYWFGLEADRRSTSSKGIYAPSSWEQGSSVGHSNDRAQLMYPFIFQGDSFEAIPALTVGVLSDVGWPLPPVGRERFVAAIVRDFVDRYATPVEMRNNALAIGNGTSRLEVARDYAYSDEWVGGLVDGYYRSTLGRGPDQSGRSYWIQVIADGTTPATVAAYFYASSEYFARSGGTNRAWVRDLYEQILDRTPDTSGHNYWTDLADRGVGRDVIALNFFQSIESRRDRVEHLYRDLLGRTPDASGHAYWADVLRNGRDVDLAVFLAGSDEYYARSMRRSD